MDSFNYREKGGETRDFYYDLECTEYRDPSPNTVQIVQQGSAASAPATASASGVRMARAAITVATTAASAAAAPLKAMVEPTRASYYADQHKSAPATAASGLQVQIVRMDDGSLEAPVYIKGSDGLYLGWTAKDMLTVVNRNAV